MAREKLIVSISGICQFTTPHYFGQKVRRFATKKPEMAKRAKILHSLCQKVHRFEKSTPPPVMTVVTNISYDCPQNSENFFLKNLIHMIFEQQLNLDSHTSEEHNLGQGRSTFCRGI